MKLSILQFDARGNELGESIAEIKGTSFKHGKFILKHAVALAGGCVDVRVKVLCVEYGNLSYRLGKEDVYPVFERPTRRKKLSKKEISAKTGGSGRMQEFRLFYPPVVFSIVAIIIFALSFIAVFVHVTKFSADSDEFFISNIRYRYATNSQDDDSPVYVVGSVGYGRQTLNIPDEVEGHPVLRIEDYAFSNDSIVRKVVVAKGVAIGRDAFSYCNDLSEVVLEGDNEVGYHAFYSCDGLQTVTINDASRIGSEAFSECGIRSLLINGCADGYNTAIIESEAFSYCGYVDEVYIDAYVNYAYNADIFRGCQVRKVYLKNYNYGEYESTSDKVFSDLFSASSSTVEILEIEHADCIPNSFLYGAHLLQSFTIYNLDSTEIGDEAFYDCYELSTVSLPNDITYVGKSAFEGTAITSFNASSLRAMGGRAFASCSKLKEVRFDNNTMLTALPVYAFSYCTSLQTFSLPQNVETIGSFAFSCCEKMESFVVPSSVTTIGDGAFDGCYRLHEIHNLSSLPIGIDSDGFGGIAFNAIGVYPDLQSSLLKKDYDGFVFKSSYGSKWCLVDYTGNEESVTLDSKGELSSYQLSRYAFDEDNASIRSITLTSAVTAVKDSTFAFLPKLTTVILKSDLRCDLPSYAFYSCSRLSSVVLPVQFNMNFNQNTFWYSTHYYYEGSRAEWAKYGYVLPTEYDGLSYYASCIHEDDEWHYVRSSINTDKSEFELITLDSPTCKTTGEGINHCLECGYTSDPFVLDALGHTYDSDGECIRCGYVYNFSANGETLKRFYEFVTLTNDKDSPFEVFDRTSYSSYIYAPRGKVSESTLEIKANTDIVISMYVYAFRGSVFTMEVGDVSRVCSDAYNGYSFTLNKGQILKITYENELGDFTDNAYLCGITISSAKEP